MSRALGASALRGNIVMALSIFVLAAAAAAHGAPAHATTKVDAAEARAQGYAEAQRALAGQGSFTPDALAANLAAGQRPPAAVSSAPVQQAPVQAAASGGSGQLNLTCVGAGTANKVTSATAWSSGRFSGYVGYTNFGDTAISALSP